MSRPNFGWDYPPGVTAQMIEDQVGGDDPIECCVCDKDVSNDKAELACRICKDALCRRCAEEFHGLCDACVSHEAGL